MNEIDIYKQINSLQEQIQSIAQMVSDQATQVTPIVKGAIFQLEQIERHNALMATMQKEIDNLKAEMQRQGQSLEFLKRTVSH